MSKIVNLGDPLNNRLTLRLSDRQVDYLSSMAKMLGISLSDFIRLEINTSMIKYENNSSLKKLNEGRVGMSIENVKTCKHDQLQ